MNPVSCPRCHSSFDVSHLQPGSRFVCGRCGNQLRVPAAPPASQPAPARRAAPRHAGYAGRTSGPSKTPFILAGAGGAVVLAVVLILVFAGSPNEPPPYGQPDAQPGVQPGQPGSGVDSGTAATDPRELERALNNKLLAAGRDVGRLHALYGEAKQARFAGIARKAAEYALQADETADWAHLEMGDVKYELPPDLPDHADEWPIPEYEEMLQAADETWLTKEKFEEVKTAEKVYLEHLSRIDSDAHYKKIWKVRLNAKLHPIFQRYEYTIVERRPYLIFVQKPKNKGDLKQLEKLAEEKATIFHALYTNYWKTFGTPFGIEPFESDDFEKDIILKAWVFADRKSFDDYNRQSGMQVGASVGAYYNPRDQWMIIPRGNMGAEMFDMHGQRMENNVCFHEGTHQIIHQITKRLVEKECGEEVSWTDPRLDSDSHWFQEGFAEYFGSAIKKEGRWENFQLNYYRLGSWKVDRARKLREWKLDEMLKASDNADLAVDRVNHTRLPQHMGALFYSQAWMFVYFLMNYDNGKYRDKFLEIYQEEIRGRSGYDEVKKVFGVEKFEGTEIEKEYFEFAKDLLDKTELTPQLKHALGIGD